MVRCSRISLRIWSSPLKCSAFPRSEVGFSGRCHWEKCGYMVTLSLHYYHCPPNQHHNVLRLQAGIIFRSNAAARHKVIRPNLRIVWFSFRKICWLQEYQQFMEDFEKLRWRSEIPKGNHWINGCKFWGRLAFAVLWSHGAGRCSVFLVEPGAYLYYKDLLESIVWLLTLV